MTLEVACTDNQKCFSLLDLPEGLVISILRCLPIESKCRAEVVCRTFRKLLSDPTPGGFVWDAIDLDGAVFQKAPLHELNWHVFSHIIVSRWLLRRMQGVFVLRHARPIQKHVGPYKHIFSEAARDQDIVLEMVLLLAGHLHPQKARLELYLGWAFTRALFPTGQLQSESQYWHSISSVLTCLELSIEEDQLSEEWSTMLCQLTRLQYLDLSEMMAKQRVAPAFQGVLRLDLPMLEGLDIRWIQLCSIHLKCPRLQSLTLHGMGVESFSGMPSSLQTIRLYPEDNSVPLRRILPAYNASALEDLWVQSGKDFTDPETVMELCLNGRLKRLYMSCACPAAGGAFSVDAVWRAIPESLQDVTLYLPLDRGIPGILEKLTRLERLFLNHTGTGQVHLDRPLDPFLAMPRLEYLGLRSHPVKSAKEPGMCRVTLSALKFLGLAKERIKQTQMTVKLFY